MISSQPQSRIASALRDRFADLVGRACALYEASLLRMPSPVERGEIARLVEPILESFADALPLEESPSPLAMIPGSAEIRELEKSVSFVGSLLAASVHSGFDVAALLTAVRDTLCESFDSDARPDLSSLFEWLGVVALDSFGTAMANQEKERQRENLERGTPIVWLTRDVPAVFLVGAPDALVVDAVMARLLLSVVRCGARVLIMDINGLVDPVDEAVLQPVSRFLQHRKLSGTRLLLVGADGEERAAWEELGRLGAPLGFCGTFSEALEQALAITNMRLVKSPGH